VGNAAKGSGEAWKGCRMVEGLRPEMLWDEAKTRAGTGYIARHVGGKLRQAGGRRSKPESEDLQSPLSKWLIIRR
jgi:hypothetical protein